MSMVPTCRPTIQTMSLSCIAMMIKLHKLSLSLLKKKHPLKRYYISVLLLDGLSCIARSDGLLNQTLTLDVWHLGSQHHTLVA